MKENEVRVGNLVFCTIREDVIEIGLSYLGYMDTCDPIPLTEEWLLKFGFVSYGVLNPTYKLNMFIIELSIFRDHYNFRKMISEKESLMLKKLKYVHQLQNLYFALTGRELELK